MKPDKISGFDPLFMRRAIELAKKGEGFVNPNPLVGAVIVKDGRIIGEGYHRRYGDLHAERDAFKSLSDPSLAEGADLYVTLEPCPMCAGAIVQARIPRVVIGCMNPKAGCAGSVIDMLHEDGFNHQVDVTTGVLQDECSGMMKSFFADLRKNHK